MILTKLASTLAQKTHRSVGATLAKAGKITHSYRIVGGYIAK